MSFLTQGERDFLSGQREFTKPQQRYIRCRLKKKLRLLDTELQSLRGGGKAVEIQTPLESVAANCSGVAAGCNGSENLLVPAAQPGRALRGHEMLENKIEPWAGFDPATSTLPR